MRLAYFLSDDPDVRRSIERNAVVLAARYGVGFVCAVEESWRPTGPYVARASDDLLLVIEDVELGVPQCHRR